MKEYRRDPDGFIILERKHSKLWEKKNYLSPIPSYIGPVYEYDIRQANVSVLRYFKRLPNVVLDELASMPKIDRNVAIGKLEREPQYAHLKKDIASGIEFARYKLMYANLLQDAEILSIKNDAIFILGRKLKYTEFGPIQFVMKHKFSLFYKIEGLEFYYSSRDKAITVKGMSDDILEEPEHQKGMLNFLRKVFDYLLCGNREGLRKYLIDFTDDYKSRKLPHCYYRELNSDNLYRSVMVIGDCAFHLENITQEQVDKIDISYNYNYFVLPILQAHLF